LVNAEFRFFAVVDFAPESAANCHSSFAWVGKIMDALLDIIPRRARRQLGLAHEANGLATGLPRAYPSQNGFMVARASRVLALGDGGKCHFHDAPVTGTSITAGKGAIQTMLAEVNGHYLLPCRSVSK
jgi:hypothetical protein